MYALNIRNLTASLTWLLLGINVGRDVPTLRVKFSGYFSGADAYFCGFLLGPVPISVVSFWDRCMCLHPFLRPMPLTYICTLRVNN